jgi:3-ketosteroid 9alpha-monooxygenase subunit B
MLGLAATGVLTFNLLLGMLLGTQYQSHKIWKRLPEIIKRVNIRTMHNYTAYVALAIAFLHPVVLLLDKTLSISLTDLLFPVNYRHQPFYMTLGSVSFYALLTIVVTSVGPLRKALSFNVWKNIHFTSYVLALLFLVHGFFMDPALKDKAADPFDAEKMLSEICFLILAVATFYRIRYQLAKNKNIPKYHKLVITEVKQQTALAKSFSLEIPLKLKEQYRYTPGQFLMFKLEIDGKTYKRAYSLSSCQDAKEPLIFTVKRIGKGIVSNYFNDHLITGQLLEVMPPSGTFFSKPENVNETNFFFFAGGSGITPVFSIIKSLLLTSVKCRLKLVYANRDESSIIFEQELQSLQDLYPSRFAIVHILSRAGENWQGAQGYISGEIIRETLKKLDQFSQAASEFYICGPSPFMETVENALLTTGISKTQIHIEKFVSLSETSEVLEVGQDQAEPELDSFPVKVTIEGEEYQVECQQGQPILDALLEAGIEAPYSCREGICSTCKAMLVSGRVKMKHHDALTDIDIMAGVILTCQACPLTKETVVDFNEA